jgi:hypothetical protein
MGEKTKYWHKWCHTCDEVVEKKKTHYQAEHPEKLMKNVKGMKAKYLTEIQGLIANGTLTGLFEEPDILFRVPKGETEDVELEDKTKIKVDRIYMFKDKVGDDDE